MTDPLAFLSGGGRAAEMIRARDWSKHALGTPKTWSAELRSAVSLVLNSPESMILAWGDDLYCLFNDTYMPLLGPRLSWAMGEPLAKVWADAWAQAKPIVDDAIAGRARRFIDMPWKLDTDRGAADTWWTFSYSRVLDATGKVAGLLIVTNETTDRVLSDAAMRESEVRLRLETERQRNSLQQMPGFAAILEGPEHRFVYVNDAYLSIGGKREYIGRPVREVFPEVEGQGFFDVLDNVYQTGEPFSAREMAVRLQGENHNRYVDIVYQPIRDDDGVTSGIFVGGYDVTETHHAKAALTESEARYRTLFSSIDEGFCIIEFIDSGHGPLSDYVHVEANAAYTRHAGIPDVVGKKVREMVPDEAQGWIDLYGSVLRTGEPIRFERELIATGRHLELAAFRVEPASRRQVAVLFQDITARKRAEAELKHLNETLEARVVEALAERKILADIVERTNAFVQVVSPDYHWLAINSSAAREFERIFGVLPKVGDNVLTVLADKPEHQAAIREVWARSLAGEDFIEVGQFGDPDRDRRHYEMHFNALRDADGNQIGSFQFTYDVTERLLEQDRFRATEEALRQSQKMEAVGQLTGGLAHDFNNLLAGISGSLELIKIRINQGRHADVEKYINAAQGASRRAAALTHRLLAFSRRQSLDPKPTNVNTLVSGMEDLIRRTVGPGVNLEVVGAAGVWTTLVDPPQLESALLNLCINARDAMPDGGRITIETANKWIDHAAARSHDMPEGQYVSLCVTDNGTGMTPDVLAKAFDPFFTTKPIGEGTGLGLSMIYGFAKQSGGQVRIYSEVGHGTTVCVYLPRYRGAAVEPDFAQDADIRPRAKEGETVLVIDDEAVVRMLVTDVLDELGYTAIEAVDGVAGLKVLESDARIDLLITDVGLPGGMNGRQVADAARTIRPGLKVLFITGYAENALARNTRLEPGMALLTKPFTVEDLGVRIREMIAK